MFPRLDDFINLNDTLGAIPLENYHLDVVTEEKKVTGPWKNQNRNYFFESFWAR